MTRLLRPLHPLLTVPMLITALRFCLAIPVYLTLRDYHWMQTLILLLLAMMSDVLDGYLARKLRQCTTIGAYLDATADFTVILAAFMALVYHLIFPLWLPLLLVGMFLQFLLTSTQGKPIYDPVGKYLGAYLYGALLALLLFQDWLLCISLIWGITILCGISLLARLQFLVQSHYQYFKVNV